jgi:hypothetical protein
MATHLHRLWWFVEKGIEPLTVASQQRADVHGVALVVTLFYGIAVSADKNEWHGGPPQARSTEGSARCSRTCKHMRRKFADLVFVVFLGFV